MPVNRNAYVSKAVRSEPSEQYQDDGTRTVRINRCEYCEKSFKAINKLFLPHNLYSGAKHIPLFSQRPFHLRVCLIVVYCPIYFSHMHTQNIYVKKSK